MLLTHLSFTHKSTGVGGNIPHHCLSLQKDVSWECVWANVKEQRSLAKSIKRAGLPHSAEDRREGGLDTAGCTEAMHGLFS